MARYQAIRRAVVAERPWYLKALIAIGVFVVPTVLRLLLGATVTPMPFVTYYPAILFAAVFAGWRWATLATAMSATAANFLFLPQSLLHRRCLAAHHAGNVACRPGARPVCR